jgi:hypothetical protein
MCSFEKAQSDKTSLMKFLILCEMKQKLEKSDWKDTELVITYI